MLRDQWPLDLRDLVHAGALLTTSGFDANRLITHMLPLEKFEDAFSLLAGHEALKVIFEIGEGRR